MKIKAIQEFKEEDRDQAVDRTYLYYKTYSEQIETAKQKVDLLETPHWGQMLFLDGVLQSSTKDEIIYHSALVYPLMDCLNRKEAILILGGGEGATAREVLKFDPTLVVMVDYDKELVDFMKIFGHSWSRGAFNDPRLRLLYDDAWEYMRRGNVYDGIVIDLTDPDPEKEKWSELLDLVIKSVKPRNGGFVMNAGLYLPWDNGHIRALVNIVKQLCIKHPEFKYYVYTVFVPSFCGEWTYIAVSHNSKFMVEPEFLKIIPDWIRRSIRMLPDSLLKDVNTRRSYN